MSSTDPPKEVVREARARSKEVSQSRVGDSSSGAAEGRLKQTSIQRWVTKEMKILSKQSRISLLHLATSPRQRTWSVEHSKDWVIEEKNSEIAKLKKNRDGRSD